jgi:hypothetical protein
MNKWIAGYTAVVIILGIVIVMQKTNYNCLELKYKQALSDNQAKVEELKTVQVALQKANHRVVVQPKATVKETTTVYKDNSAELKASYDRIISRLQKYYENNYVKKDSVVSEDKSAQMKADYEKILDDTIEIMNENMRYDIKNNRRIVVEKEYIKDGGSVSEPIIPTVTYDTPDEPVRTSESRWSYGGQIFKDEAMGNVYYDLINSDKCRVALEGSYGIKNLGLGGGFLIKIK